MRVFMRSGEDIFRVAHEDVQGLSRRWNMWLPEGVVPEPSREGPEWVAWEEAPFDNPVPRPKKRSEDHRLLALYQDGQLLIAKFEFYRWLDDKTQTPKTGAPGRPSSMRIVITEFERRRELQQCEQSRGAKCRLLQHGSSKRIQRCKRRPQKQSATSSQQTFSPAPDDARNYKIGHHFGHLYRASYPSLSPCAS